MGAQIVLKRLKSPEYDKGFTFVRGNARFIRKEWISGFNEINDEVETILI